MAFTSLDSWTREPVAHTSVPCCPAASHPRQHLSLPTSSPLGETRPGYGGPAQAPLAGWHLSPTPLHTCPQRAFERLSEVPVAKNNPGESTKSLRANVVTFIFKNSGEPLALAFLGQKVALGCDGPRAGVLPLGPV